VGRRIVGALLCVGLLAAACGSGDSGDGGDGSSVAGPGGESFVPGAVALVDLPRATTGVSEADVAAVVAGDTAFGLDLFVAAAGDDNIMVSPYSVATALSMLYPGAKGATATEIAEVLHLTVDDATLHSVRNHIDTALATPPPPVGEEDTREPFTVRPANSAWGQGGYPFLDDYLGVLAEHYGAGLRLVDYAGDPDGSRRLINDWVEEATEGRIEDLLPEGSVDDLTRLALVNAIWFKANWASEFEPAATRPGAFTLLDGSEVQVPLMHGSIRTGYVRTERFEAVRLRYAGDAAMVVMVPTSGSPAEVAATLAPEDLRPSWGDYEVEVTLPSFEFDAGVELVPVLQRLGMQAVFTPPSKAGGADLTGITERRELFVTGVFHKTFIALDEEGTEAAAATVVTGGVTSQPEPATFTADRPFLFWIEQSSTGEVLFLGQVTDPR
jgi:serpin B